MGRLFTAQYTSRCPACDELIEPGEDIGYVDDYDKPVHEDCWEQLGGDEGWD